MIRFERLDSDVPACLNSDSKIWIRSVLEAYKKTAGSIFFLFCSDEALLKINQQFLNHDYYTDVITFNQSSSENVISGEIYISVERILENATLLKVDFFQELHRVLIHGILHLIGFNDTTERERKEMRKREQISLSLLPIN
jgi:rRNA maturation RNase YbeY